MISAALVGAALTGGLVGTGLNACAAWLPAHGPWSVGRATATATARWRELALPAAAALVGAFMWWRFGPTWRLLPAALSAGLLLLIAAIDLDRRLILNELLLGGSLLALGTAALGGGPPLLAALAGGALGLGLFLVLALVQRGGMGAGDVKLAGLIGLILGYPQALTALLAGIVIGGVVAGILLLSRRVGRRSTIAYAPFLSAGAIIVLLAG